MSGTLKATFQTVWGRGILRVIRMVTRTSCITSGSGRIRRSRNSLGLSTWGTATTPSCTGPARSRRSTAVSSKMRNPPTGRRGLGAFRNRSLTEYIQRNKCRVARSAPTGDEFLHIRCLRVPHWALGRRSRPYLSPQSAALRPWATFLPLFVACECRATPLGQRFRLFLLPVSAGRHPWATFSPLFVACECRAAPLGVFAPFRCL